MATGPATLFFLLGAVGEQELTPTQRLPSSKWVRLVTDVTDVKSSLLVVQVGANDHSDDGGHDPAQVAVQLGWSALLFEPMMHAYAALERRYSSTSREVTLRNAAVCPPQQQFPFGHPPPSMPGAHKTMWYVELSNATGSWGTYDADVRCVVYMPHQRDGQRSGVTRKTPWVTQLASFSRAGLLQAGPAFGYTPKACKHCGRLQGRALGTKCLRHVLERNVMSRKVDCARFDIDLARRQRPTMLVVDVEGFDAEVLAAFPFGSGAKPAQVVYEISHMSTPDFKRLTRELTHLGYACIAGCRNQPREMNAEWHLLGASV
mmetsp:Transcript_3280/g.9521  ORF Transcript_3280/g.9521 Transcript_3280/m.9521 type:complete len:318 (+) Transcript_3280:7-960(+)